MTSTGMGNLRTPVPNEPAQLPAANGAAAPAPRVSWWQRLTGSGAPAPVPAAPAAAGDSIGPAAGTNSALAQRILTNNQTYDRVAPAGVETLRDLQNTYGLRDFALQPTESIFQLPSLYPARPDTLNYLRAWAQSSRRRALSLNGMGRDGRTATVHLVATDLRNSGINTHIFEIDDLNMASGSGDTRNQRVNEFFTKLNRYITAQRAETPNYQAVLYVRNSRSLFQGDGIESRRAFRDNLVAVVGNGTANGNVRVILEGTSDLFGRMRDAFGNDVVEEYQMPSPSEAEMLAILRIHARQYENLIPGRVLFTDDFLRMALRLAPNPLGGVGARSRLATAMDLLDAAYQHMMNVSRGLARDLVTLTNHVQSLELARDQFESDQRLNAPGSSPRSQAAIDIDRQLGVNFQVIKDRINRTQLSALFEQITPTMAEEVAIQKAREIIGADVFGFRALQELRQFQVEHFLSLHRVLSDPSIGVSAWEQIFENPERRVDASLVNHFMASQGVTLGPKGMMVATAPTARQVAPNLGLAIGRQVSLKQEMQNLRAYIRQRISGQEAAIDDLMDLYLQMNSDVVSHARPVKFFRGPPGVGKTRLAEVFAEGANIGFFLVDCGKMKASHEVAALIGSPPGYDGNKDDGLLVQALRSFQRTGGRGVILFDEIEKANASVFEALLNILNSGRFTDQHGTIHDFTKVTFLFASNIGSEALAEFGRQMQRFHALSAEHNVARFNHYSLQDIVNRFKELGREQNFEAEYVALGNVMPAAEAAMAAWATAEKEFAEKFSTEFRNRVGIPITFDNLTDDQLREVLSFRFAQAKKDALEVGIQLQIGADDLNAEARSAAENALFTAIIKQNGNNTQSVRDLIRSFEGSLMSAVRVIHLEADHIIRNTAELSSLPETQAELLRGTRVTLNVLQGAVGAPGVLNVKVNLNECGSALGDNAAAMHTEFNMQLGDSTAIRRLIQDFDIRSAGAPAAAAPATGGTP